MRRSRPHAALRRVAALVLVGLVAGCSQQGGSDAAGSASQLAASQTAAPSAEADSESVILAYLDALNQGDFEAAAQLFAPNAVMMNPTGAGPTETLATAEEAAAYLERAVPACQHEFVGMHQDDDHILAAVVVSGEECPVPAGTEIEMPFRIVDGRIECICPPETSRKATPTALILG